MKIAKYNRNTQHHETITIYGYKVIKHRKTFFSSKPVVQACHDPLGSQSQ